MRLNVSYLLACLSWLIIPLLPASAAESTGKSAYDFSFETAHGEDMPLSAYKGKLLMVVNTATECGFKEQIGDLQTLWEQYKDRGLVVLGVPSNDFGGQEPRSNEELAGFCEVRFGAKFPMTAKVHVKGNEAHPFYQWAASEMGIAARPYWNFHKYLIGPDGRIIAWFATPTRPTSSTVTSEIDTALATLPVTQ